MIPKTWKEFGDCGDRCHFVLEFNDDGRDMIVYKIYSRSKQKFYYKISQKSILMIVLKINEEGSA